MGEGMTTETWRLRRKLKKKRKETLILESNGAASNNSFLERQRKSWEWVWESESEWEERNKIKWLHFSLGEGKEGERRGFLYLPSMTIVWWRMDHFSSSKLTAKIHLSYRTPTKPTLVFTDRIQSFPLLFCYSTTTDYWLPLQSSTLTTHTKN